MTSAVGSRERRDQIKGGEAILLDAGSTVCALAGVDVVLAAPAD